MKRILIWLALPVVAAAVILWPSSQFDVVIESPAVAVDRLDYTLPHLNRAIVEHPDAKSIQINYRLVPDPSHPEQSLNNSLDYYRHEQRFEWHRNMPWFDRY